MSYDLFLAWYGVADWCAYDLIKQGCESVVLRPLGKHSQAATLIACGAAESDDYMHRKVAAELAGWIVQPPETLLAELFAAEVERDKRFYETDVERLKMQSVMENIVFASAQWARSKRTSSAGLAVLEDVVQSAIDGQFWNTARDALTALCHHSHRRYRDLATRYLEFAQGEPPTHPTTNSFESDRKVAEQILARDPSTLSSVARTLDEQERSANTEIEETARAALDYLLQVAEYFEVSQ